MQPLALSENGYEAAPLSRRFLAGLIDIAAGLILTFLLFAFASMPVSEKVGGFASNNARQKELQSEVYSIFYDSHLYSKGSDDAPIGKLAFYNAYRAEKIAESQNPNQERSDPFAYYYVNYAKSLTLSEVDTQIFGLPEDPKATNTSPIFAYDTTVSDPKSVLPLLRSDTDFAKNLAAYNESSPTAEGKAAEEAFQDFFVSAWDAADQALKASEPLASDLGEFAQLTHQQYGILVAALWIAYACASLLVYLLLPLCLGKGRTLGLLILSLQRLDFDFSTPKRWLILPFFFGEFLLEQPLMLLCALPMAGFSKIGALPWIPFVDGTSLWIACLVASFGYLVNGLLGHYGPNNATLADYLCHSVVIEKPLEVLDHAQ